MTLEKHYTMKEASRILGVSVRRLQIWDKEGKIKRVRTLGGRRRIPESELKRLLGIREIDTSKKAVIYVRVSSHEPKAERGFRTAKTELVGVFEVKRL